MDHVHVVERKLSLETQIDKRAVELKQLVDLLYAAAVDDAIKGVAVDMKNGTMVELCGLADLEEVHRVLPAVHEAGKSVASYHATVTGLRSFDLCGAAETSILHPRGTFAAPGLIVQSFFGRRLSDNL
mgnify:CR=1 FL=1